MKRIITSLVIAFISFSLISCQNMTKQDVGTVAGAVGGGLLGSTVGGGSGRALAIGAGVLAGAYLGGAIGKHMDDADRMHVNRALENNKTGQPAYWHNDKSDADYQVTPVKNVSVRGNKYCREYQTVATINGEKQKMYGTACRQPDGSWKAVR